MSDSVGKTQGTRVIGGPSPAGLAAIWVLWIILIVAGIYGLFQRIAYGHLLAGYGSYVPWGLWIGLYFLGIGVSGGAFLIGGVAYILGLPGFAKKSELRTAIVLSLAGLLPAFVGVILDLGRMERLFNLLIYPSFTSMMAFNAWMYNIFIVIAVICWLLSFAKESLWLKPLIILGSFLSILFPSQSGVFFEAVRTNEFWHSPILSILFLASAVALGGAALLLVKLLMGPASSSEADAKEHHEASRMLRLVTAAGIVIYLVFEFAELSIAFWNPGARSPNVVFLLLGDYWPVFWILHIIVGSAIPIILLFMPSTFGWGLASLLALIGFTAARMSVLVPGQIAGQIAGLQEAFQDPRLVYSYHATPMEYLVGCLMVALAMALFYVGLRLGKAMAPVSEQKA